ncbi:MAG TPA: response regulator transcription factor [Pyrinomonadaceae bacterium]|nr:response regulator transcription factor [Pyrinomonadaceae bacterium]
MSKRLLIVDDEPNLLRAVAAVLRGEGFEVSTARNGREALVSVAQNPPDLIVSDVRMPGMDGYALARRLRSAPNYALIPIVFLTAKDEIDDRIEGFRSGVDVYLTKPFEPNELVVVIRNILARVERTHSTIARLVGNEDAEETVFVRDEELTEAEWRVAESVARGLSNKEIAQELNLSIRTIENHVSRILAKKNFSNRVEIARHIISQKPE